MKICKVYFVLIVSFLLFCIHETKYQENPSNDQIAAFYHVAHTHTGKLIASNVNTINLRLISVEVSLDLFDCHLIFND
jgi:hypothetical protein